MKVCEVKIFGQTYSLRADIDEGEVRRVAELVDSRMRQVANSAPAASALQVAVLAALDLAGEVSKPPPGPNGSEIIGLVESRADAMLKLLDAVEAEQQLA